MVDTTLYIDVIFRNAEKQLNGFKTQIQNTFKNAVPKQTVNQVIDSGELIKPEVKVGDKVLYGKYSGTEVTIESKEYLIVRESDILAIV